MTTTAGHDRLASHDALQGVTVAELTLRVARHPDGFSPEFAAAAEMTAGLPAGDVSQMAYQTLIATPANPALAAALAEIAADRYQAERP
jgi:hypothetical protein